MEKEIKKPSPYFNFSWLIYILMIVIGVIIARTLFGEIISEYNSKLPLAVFDILIIVYGFLSCVLVYHLGKLLFGKIAGFRMSYFNLIICGFENIDGKIKFYKGYKDDMSIRVQLVPNRENPNTKLALWGGSIFTLIAFGITYGLIFGLNVEPTIKFFFLMSSVFYAFAFINYMIPCRMDRLNDGLALLLIKKSKTDAIYLRNLKNIDALLHNKEIEYYPYSENDVDPLSMEGKIYNYYYLMNNNRFDEAGILALKESENNKYFIEENQVSAILIGKIFYMCNKGQFQELEEFYWKLDTNTRHIFGANKSYESIKTSLYIKGYIDVEYEGFLNILKKRESLKKKYHYLANVEVEDRIIDETLQKVYSVHPEWKEEVKENEEN